MSELKPYQQRVVVEHDELTVRLDKLRAFLASDTIETISRAELVVLGMQLLAMECYEGVLRSRIEAFQQPPG